MAPLFPERGRRRGRAEVVRLLHAASRPGGGPRRRCGRCPRPCRAACRWRSPATATRRAAPGRGAHRSRAASTSSTSSSSTPCRRPRRPRRPAAGGAAGPERGERPVAGRRPTVPWPSRSPPCSRRGGWRAGRGGWSVGSRRRWPSPRRTPGVSSCSARRSEARGVAGRRGGAGAISSTAAGRGRRRRSVASRRWCCWSAALAAEPGLARFHDRARCGPRCIGACRGPCSTSSAAMRPMGGAAENARDRQAMAAGGQRGGLRTRLGAGGAAAHRLRRADEDPRGLGAGRRGGRQPGGRRGPRGGRTAASCWSPAKRPSWWTAVARLAAEPELYGRLVAGGRAVLARRHAPAAVAAELLGVYRTVAERARERIGSAR